jgi:hypothetical protein
VNRRPEHRQTPSDADADASESQAAASTLGAAENIRCPGRRGFIVAIVVGFAFGAADQYLGSRITLGLWAATVSGASAPWLLMPFAFGCSQVRPRRAMVLGLLVTVAALAGYFTLMWSPLEGVALSQSLPELPTLLRSQWANIFGGLVTGPLFGLLGQRWRTNRSWVSAALVTGALCLEPLARWLAGQLAPPAFVWAIEVAAGVLLALFFVVVGTSRDHETV